MLHALPFATFGEAAALARPPFGQGRTNRGKPCPDFCVQLYVSEFRQLAPIRIDAAPATPTAKAVRELLHRG